MTFEIREWIRLCKGCTIKRCVVSNLNLEQAFDKWKELKEKEPNKVFSIFRERGKNEY